MDTSDDPVSIGMLALGGGAGIFAANRMNKPVTPAPPSQTSMVSNHLGDDPASQEQANRKRQKMLASVMTKDWEQPVLGQGGLVGL